MQNNNIHCYTINTWHIILSCVDLPLQISPYHRLH